MRCLFATITVSFALGCAPSTSVSEERLQPSARVEIVAAGEAPEASDAVPRVDVRITRGDVAHDVVDVVGAIAWREGALIVGADGALTHARADGNQSTLDVHVSMVPVLAPDGERYVYARHADETRVDLIAAGTGAPAVLAHGLASVGALHFVDDERFVFVGATSGGVAGLWTASLASPRLAECLTNCTLRAGRPWDDAFVPPPTDLDAIVLEGSSLRFVDGDGHARIVSLEATR